MMLNTYFIMITTSSGAHSVLIWAIIKLITIKLGREHVNIDVSRNSPCVMNTIFEHRNNMSLIVVTMTQICTKIPA